MYFKDPENKLHWLDSKDNVNLLPNGAVEIMDEEADELRKPASLTLADLAEAVRIALQSAIDDKAKSFGFSGGNALMLYAGFINPFQPLAQVFATWEASVWVEADAYKADVIAGNKPMLSGAEAVALMPVYPS